MRTPTDTRKNNKNSDTKIRNDPDSIPKNNSQTTSIENKKTKSYDRRNIQFMDKQISTTTKDPYTRTHHISNNQYNKNKNQQNNKPADTTTKYNDKQNDKITKYRHSIKKQKSVLISKSHILLQSKANKNTETNPIKHNENKYCTYNHCTKKNNNVPITTATVLPYPNIHSPKIK